MISLSCEKCKTLLLILPHGRNYYWALNYVDSMAKAAVNDGSMVTANPDSTNSSTHNLVSGAFECSGPYVYVQSILFMR